MPLSPASCWSLHWKPGWRSSEHRVQVWTRAALLLAVMASVVLAAGDGDGSRLESPGLKLRISRYGLDNATAAIIKHFAADVKNVSSAGSASFVRAAGLVSGVFRWRELHVTRFTPFTLEAEPVPPGGGGGDAGQVRVWTRGGQLALNVLFDYELIAAPWPLLLSGAGRLALASSDLALNFALQVGTNPHGNPQPAILDCRATIQLDYELENDWKARLVLWSIKLFYGSLDNYLRSLVCERLSQLADAISQDNVTLTYRVNDYVFDYRLVKPMLTFNDSIELYSKAVVSWDGAESKIPFSPAPIPHWPSAKMGTLFLSDNVLNTQTC